MKQKYSSPELEVTLLLARDILMVSGDLASDNEIEMDGGDLYPKS